MWAMGRLLLIATLMVELLAGCGLAVPVKSELRSDEPGPREPGKTGFTQQGAYENGIVNHVACELALGVYKAKQDFALPWLDSWGTAVTITITAQDQSGLSPGISFIDPLHNVIQTFPVG